MKSPLITGGSRVIGRAICTKMAASGYYIMVNRLSLASPGLACITAQVLFINGGLYS